jgi:site-specific DNA recombinase
MTPHPAPTRTVLEPPVPLALPTRDFAFYGRVSTEDQQDPEASRNWQKTRANGLIEPLGGRIVTDFFDIGMSRSIPWQRRPDATALLDALADRNRGFDAVVIGEPQRAFYDNQYSLTMPLFSHYGVQLWVPEVGGPIDPNSEAHDLIMGVFGGMSKGERNRIKIRVRSAMSAQAKIEGRFLGGRPPYGYMLADAGPHPNPAKAADGKRLHRLVPDPVAAPVVRRIFAEYLRGRGFKAIAAGLTRDGILCPSAHDRARNPHRNTIAWNMSIIRVIVTNPRYTGRQVWNKQRKAEVLIDIRNVADGYETKLKWNKPGDWVWSDQIAHEPLITVEDFEATAALMASRAHKGATLPRENRPTTRHYLLRGLLHCGICGRKMQASTAHGTIYYRCLYPEQVAKANHIPHPRGIYLREDSVVPKLDTWLSKAFAPHNLDTTVAALADASDQDDQATADAATHRTTLAECDRKLAQYRTLLDQGTDPTIVAAWIREVEIERIGAQAKLREATGRTAMTTQEITAIVTAIGDMIKILATAQTADKIELYARLGLQLEYDINANAVTVTMEPLDEPGDINPGTQDCLRNNGVRGGT